MSDLLLSKLDGSVIQQRRLDPSRGYWIGRESTCDFIIEHPEVSRRHAFIFQSNGRWLACDAGSPDGFELESGPKRFAQLSSESYVAVGGVYIWLTKAASTPPDWVDAAPTVDAGGTRRFVRLAAEEIEEAGLDGLLGGAGDAGAAGASAQGPESAAHGKPGAEGATDRTRPAQLLVVTDKHGGVHLCADLSALSASRGTGTARLTIGRSTAVDLQLCHRSVDPLHCVIALGRERWSVLDAGSSSGILHDGKRWYRKRLEHGITVPIGDFRISVQDVRRPAPTQAITAPLTGTGPGRSGGEAAGGTPPPPPPPPRRPSVFLDPAEEDEGGY